MADVTVSVPAKPEFVHVLRSVVASVAARASFTFDEIDDLRLAVDEACAQLLAFPPPATTLELRIAFGDAGTIEVVASTDADAGAAIWPPEGAERTLTWQVLSALADEARFESAGARPGLRIIKHRETAPTT